MRHPVASDLGESWLPYAFKTLPLSNHAKRFCLEMVSQFDLCKGGLRGKTAHLCLEKVPADRKEC